MFKWLKNKQTDSVIDCLRKESNKRNIDMSKVAKYLDKLVNKCFFTTRTYYGEFDYSRSEYLTKITGYTVDENNGEILIDYTQLKREEDEGGEEEDEKIYSSLSIEINYSNHTVTFGEYPSEHLLDQLQKEIPEDTFNKFVEKYTKKNRFEEELNI